MAVSALKSYTSHLLKLRLCQVIAGHHSRLSSSTTHSSSDSSSDEEGSHDKSQYSHNTADDTHAGSGGAESTEGEIRDRILQSALQYVPEYGWSKKALIAGAEAEGYPSVTHGMFPSGGADLVTHFYKTCNAALVESMVAWKEQEQEMGENMGTTAFIRDSVEERLRMNIPYMDSWSQAMAIMVLPQNARQGWTNLVELINEIWYYAGDTSTDINYYSKRASLAAVYKSSEIYMLKDESEDYTHTWAFLDRRIQDTITMGKFTQQASNFGSTSWNTMWGACEVARNVTGMGDRRR